MGEKSGETARKGRREEYWCGERVGMLGCESTENTFSCMRWREGRGQHRERRARRSEEGANQARHRVAHARFAIGEGRGTNRDPSLRCETCTPRWFLWRRPGVPHSTFAVRGFNLEQSPCSRDANADSDAPCQCIVTASLDDSSTSTNAPVAAVETLLQIRLSGSCPFRARSDRDEVRSHIRTCKSRTIPRVKSTDVVPLQASIWIAAMRGLRRWLPTLPVAMPTTSTPNSHAPPTPRGHDIRSMSSREPGESLGCM